MPRIPTSLQAALSTEIAAAGGREVSFVAQVGQDGEITSVRVVARGTVEMVLALPGSAQRGEMLLHNHPSGVLEPSIGCRKSSMRLEWCTRWENGAPLLTVWDSTRIGPVSVT